MKILILGGAGRSARAAIGPLMKSGGVERILLSDRNAEALSKLCADLWRFPLSPRYLEAECDRDLLERMYEADLVMGCLGPFHRYERRLAEAAISAGRDYISLCDDPEALREVMRLGEEARRRGVSLICGCGLTPGLSNLLACQASSRMESVDSLELSWFLEIGKDTGIATLEHLLHALSGSAATYMKGREIESRAGSWEERVEFPPPLGWREVVYLDHPEPLTLHRSIEGVRDIWVKGGINGRGRGLVLQTLAWLSGNLDSELGATVMRSAVAALANRAEGGCLSVLRLAARGSIDGSRTSLFRAVGGDYYRVTGLFLAAALRQRYESGWPSGVHSPEEVLDWERVLPWLRARGVRFVVGEEKGDRGEGREEGSGSPAGWNGGTLA